MEQIIDLSYDQLIELKFDLSVLKITKMKYIIYGLFEQKLKKKKSICKILRKSYAIIPTYLFTKKIQYYWVKEWGRKLKKIYYLNKKILNYAVAKMIIRSKYNVSHLANLVNFDVWTICIKHEYNKFYNHCANTCVDFENTFEIGKILNKVVLEMKYKIKNILIQYDLNTFYELNKDILIDQLSIKTDYILK